MRQAFCSYNENGTFQQTIIEASTGAKLFRLMTLENDWFYTNQSSSSIKRICRNLNITLKARVKVLHKVNGSGSVLLRAEFVFLLNSDSPIDKKSILTIGESRLNLHFDVAWRDTKGQKGFTSSSYRRGRNVLLIVAANQKKILLTKIICDITVNA